MVGAAGYNVAMLKRIILICLLSNIAWAECDHTSSQHFPSKTAPNYYGNSRTGSFNCAVTGEADELTSAQLSERAELLPESHANRFYVRLGGNVASEGVISVKNNSQGGLIGATIQDSTGKTASNNIEFAFGYAWKEWAIDLEWLGLKSVDYTSTLQQITPNLDFSTTVSGDAILANVYWIFKDIYSIQLYGLICGGVTKNDSTASLNNGTSVALNHNGISYGLGFGGRFNIISKLYADMAARYIILGKVKYLARNPAQNLAMQLQATRNWFGMSFRLLWLF